MCANLRTVAESSNTVNPTRLLYCCLFAPHMPLFAHNPFVVNRAFSATPVQQCALLFSTNCADRTCFLGKLQTAQPSRPGHSTILLRTESLSGMCAKLRTVATSNNRVHPTRSLCYYLFAPHIYGVVLRTHSVRGEPRIQRNARGRGCNNLSNEDPNKERKYSSTSISVNYHSDHSPISVRHYLYCAFQWNFSSFVET